MPNPLNIGKLKTIKANLPTPLVGIQSWKQPIVLQKKTQEVNDYGDIEETLSTINFQGVVQPLDPEEIKLKPEGQWSWSWYRIHTPVGVSLSTNDVLIYEDHEFKVMAVKDYSDYGYLEYHCVRDWSENGGD